MQEELWKQVYELAAMPFDGVATDSVDWKIWDMTTLSEGTGG